MRKLGILTAVLLAACGTKSMTGDDTGADAAAAVCALPSAMADAGDLTALKAERCNVPGSMGSKKWFRLSAVVPAGPMDIVQLELWPGLGAFAATDIAVGTYTISGADAADSTCGLCLRAIGDKGLPTQKFYFATAGTVDVTAIGAAPAPISATVTNAVFAEVDATNAFVSGGCGASLAGVKVDGTVMDVGGTGGGTGGGGGGGTGMCPRTIGD
jgi:hypothetical protein